MSWRGKIYRFSYKGHNVRYCQHRRTNLGNYTAVTIGKDTIISNPCSKEEIKKYVDKHYAKKKIHRRKHRTHNPYGWW